MATHDKGHLSLFKNNYKDSDNKPELTGNGTLPKVQLQQLVERLRETGDDEIKIDCAAWAKKDKNGNTWFSVSFEVQNLEYAKDSDSSGGGGSGDDGFNFDV